MEPSTTQDEWEDQELDGQTWFRGMHYRSKRMEEKSWKQGRVEARFEGGQDQEGAVAPNMEWNGITLISDFIVLIHEISKPLAFSLLTILQSHFL